MAARAELAQHTEEFQATKIPFEPAVKFFMSFANRRQATLAAQAELAQRVAEIEANKKLVRDAAWENKAARDETKRMRKDLLDATDAATAAQHALEVEQVRHWDEPRDGV